MDYVKLLFLSSEVHGIQGIGSFIDEVQQEKSFLSAILKVFIWST